VFRLPFCSTRVAVTKRLFFRDSTVHHSGSTVIFYDIGPFCTVFAMCIFVAEAPSAPKALSSCEDQVTQHVNVMLSTRAPA